MTNLSLFNLTDLNKEVLSHWKHLTIITILAIVLSYIFSGPYFIKRVYKSSAVTYPVNLSSYSTESATEQLLQLLLSDDIKDSIIRKFDLIGHYNLNAGNRFAYSAALNRLERNVSIVSTRFESVKITVYDHDPEIAFLMVNEWIEQTNLKIRTIYRKQFNEVFTIVKTQMDLKKSELDSLDARLKELTVNYELFDVPAQANEVVRGYLGTVDGSNGQMVNQKNVLQFMKNIINYGAEHIRTSGYSYTSRNEYLNLKNQWENVQKEITKHLTYMNIVTQPRIAEMPVFPVRWLIVLGCSVSAFAMGLVIILLIGRKKRYN